MWQGSTVGDGLEDEFSDGPFAQTREVMKAANEVAAQDPKVVGMTARGGTSVVQSKVFQEGAEAIHNLAAGRNILCATLPTQGPFLQIREECAPIRGKGLKAAMVVSLLAGALRNRKSDEPAALLRELNAVVADGLDGGFVTAAVARCHADGRAVLANAGNPAPYVAGAEVALDSGLPLGIDRDAEYPEHALVPQPGERLTFVSDGVVEAENAQRELFGFDRTREISTKSAQEIADAAKAWAQNDDISVVTVTRRKTA